VHAPATVHKIKTLLLFDAMPVNERARGTPYGIDTSRSTRIAREVLPRVRLALQALHRVERGGAAASDGDAEARRRLRASAAAGRRRRRRRCRRERHAGDHEQRLHCAQSLSRRRRWSPRRWRVGRRATPQRRIDDECERVGGAEATLGRLVDSERSR
jgi:hypothetical protein